MVDRASDGRDGLFLAGGEKHDVLIVDRMLPGLDRLVIVKTIRGAGVKTPILFLIAVDGIDDRVEGLEAGGDDYLTKPFALAELTARVNALFRRPAPAEAGTALCVGDLRMDLLRRIVRRGDQVIKLEPREFRLQFLRLIRVRRGSATERLSPPLPRTAIGVAEAFKRGFDRNFTGTQLANAPLYAARIEDLGPGEFVKIDGAAYRHVALLTPEALLRLGLSPAARVLDLKGRLRCRGCGRKGRAVVSVEWAPEKKYATLLLRGTNGVVSRSPVRRCEGTPDSAPLFEGSLDW